MLTLNVSLAERSYPILIGDSLLEDAALLGRHLPARDLLLVSASANKRSYPASVHYITSPGYLSGGGERERLGYKPGTGPKALVNPLGIFRFDGNGEMYAAELHAGVSADEVRATFGWPIKVQPGFKVLPEPTAHELTIIREELAHAKKRYYLMPEG